MYRRALYLTSSLQGDYWFPLCVSHLATLNALLLQVLHPALRYNLKGSHECSAAIQSRECLHALDQSRSQQDQSLRKPLHLQAWHGKQAEPRHVPVRLASPWNMHDIYAIVVTHSLGQMSSSPQTLLRSLRCNNSSASGQAGISGTDWAIGQTWHDAMK